MVYIGSLDYDEQIVTAAEIIIYGGGSMLPQLLKKLEQLNLTGNITAICDKNASIQGKTVSGIPVLPPDRIYQDNKDADYIVYNRYYMEICKQLLENQITRIHLIRQGSL